MITLILPSLNVAPFIRQCMDSVVGQIYKDLEILCIDAGSTDGTLEILREYEKRDARVSVIVSDKKSYGYQVNIGIDKARGDYIGVVETDDFIEPDMYEVMLKALIENRAQMVKAKAIKFYNDYKDRIYDRIISPLPEGDERFGQVISTADYPEIIVRDIFLWLGLYKKEFLSNIRLNETPGAAYQDIGFQVQVLSKVEKAVYLNRVFYHYRLDNAGASSFNQNAFKYLDEEYDFVLPMVKDSAWKSYVYQKMWNQTYGRMHLMARSGRYWQESEEHIRGLGKKFRDAKEKGVLKNPGFSAPTLDEIDEFIEDSKGLYEKLSRSIEGQVEALGAFMELIDKTKVVVFGCGNWGKHVGRILTACKDVELYFTDNNEFLWDTMVDGTPVVSPKEAREIDGEPIFVVANKKYSGEIIAQLEAGGISKTRIVNYTIGYIDPWVLDMVVKG